MPYIKKVFHISKPIVAYKFLMQEFNLSLAYAQRWIDKNRVFYNGKILDKKSLKLKGLVEVVTYENTSKNMQIVYNHDNFAVFEKPPFVLSHPSSKVDDYSVLDEAKHNFGQNANIIHRLDYETSGLIMVSKNLEAEVKLKTMLENKQIYKTYVALVKGKLEKSFYINAPLLINDNFEYTKVRMFLHSKGKISQTLIIPEQYYADINATYVIIKPLTGRQHQIRAHMFHVKHCIIAEPLYGVSFENASLYLDKKLSVKERINITGAKRLLLHAICLKFEYNGKIFDIQSNFDAKNEFLKLAREKYASS